MDLILIVILIIFVWVLINVIRLSGHEKKHTKQANNERVEDTFEEQSRKSLEYFERIQQQNLVQSHPDPNMLEAPSVQKQLFFQASDLEPNYDNLESLKIPQKSLLHKTIKKEGDKLVAEIKARTRIEDPWAELMKPGDKIIMKKVGRSTVLLYTQEWKKLDSVEYPFSKYLYQMRLENVDCKITRVTKSKIRGYNITVSIKVDAKEFAQIEFPELARWDPLSREHFWISLNGGAFGERRWKRKSGSVAPFCNIRFQNKESLAEQESQRLIKNRRFKCLPDENLFETSPGVESIIVYLKGLNYRSDAAKKAAEELNAGDFVVIVPDDNNDYDTNAVAVFTISGLLLGYVDKRNAEFLRDEVWEIIDCPIITSFPDISINVNYVKNKNY